MFLGVAMGEIVYFLGVFFSFFAFEATSASLTVTTCLPSCRPPPADKHRLAAHRCAGARRLRSTASVIKKQNTQCFLGSLKLRFSQNV